MYLQSPEGRVDQGDIIRPFPVDRFLPSFDPTYRSEDGVVGVVITPACDVEQGKAEYHKVLLGMSLRYVALAVARKRLGAEELERVFGGDQPASKTRARPIASDLWKIIGNSFPRWHFLPPADGMINAPQCVDFQLCVSVPVDEVELSLRVARVDAPYIQKLLARYAAFAGRVGTRDEAEDARQNYLDAALPEVIPAGLR